MLRSKSVRRAKQKVSVCLFSLLVWSVPVNFVRAKTTWTVVYSNPNQDNLILNIDAVDGQTAWAVGVDSGTGNTTPIGIRTTDGINWSPMTLPQVGGGPMDLAIFTLLAFSDSSSGFMAGIQVSIQGEQAHLWKTGDGGGSWNEVFLPADPLEQIQALPSGQFFGGGGSTVVLSDDGQSFVEVNPSLPQDTAIQGIHMLNPDCGYLAAATDPEAGPLLSAVLWSGDGGRTWEVRAQDLPGMIRRIWFASADRGWAVGWQGASAAQRGLLASTSDGGRTFAPATLPDHPPMMGGDPVPVSSCEEVRFFDESRGITTCMACSGGCDTDQPTLLTVFARTYDGGQTWEMDPDYEEGMAVPPFGEMMKASGLRTMAFPEPNAGFLAGDNQFILRYVADDPEQPAAPPATCSGSNTNNNTNNNTNGNGNGSAGANDGALYGCGCRAGQSRNDPLRWGLILLLSCLLAGAGRRRPR